MNQENLINLGEYKRSEYQVLGNNALKLEDLKETEVRVLRTPGFSKESEVEFLQRLPVQVREKNLGLELKTQLAEDFGLVEFTKKYIFRNGILVDPDSGEGPVELTSRGEVKEETRAITMIETGLRENREKIWIHFSPKNEKLGYTENYVDVWRNDGDEVIWNRMSVKNDFREMNRVREMLGESECEDEMEILGSPMAVKIELDDIFTLFELSKNKYYEDFSEIEEVVRDRIVEYREKFGDNLTSDSDLIFRIYSACHKLLRAKEKGVIVSRRDLNNVMFGEMTGTTTEDSFGCSGTTVVGEFGEKGWYVAANGQVVFDFVPKECKICEKCGMPYLTEKCPFC